MFFDVASFIVKKPEDIIRNEASEAIQRPSDFFWRSNDIRGQLIKLSNKIEEVVSLLIFSTIAGIAGFLKFAVAGTLTTSGAALAGTAVFLSASLALHLFVKVNAFKEKYGSLYNLTIWQAFKYKLLGHFSGMTSLEYRIMHKIYPNK